MIEAADKKYISLAEAAEGTPYSQEYLSLLVRKGKLSAQKIGRNWFTTRDDVERYIERQKINLVEKIERKKVYEVNAVSDIKEGHRFFDLTLEQLGIGMPEEGTPAVVGTSFSFDFTQDKFKSFAIDSLVFVFAGVLFFSAGVFGTNLYRNLTAVSVFPEKKIASSIFDTSSSQLKLVFGDIKIGTDHLQKFAAIAEEKTGVISFLRKKLIALTYSFQNFLGVSSQVEMADKSETDLKEEADKEIVTSPQPNIFTVPPEVRIREIIERKEVLAPADVTSLKTEIFNDVEKANSNFRQKFESALEELRVALSRTSSRTDSNVRMISLTQKIDNLDGTTLKNIKVEGISGLTDSDIPNTITVTGSQSLSSLTVSSGLTLSGDLAHSGVSTTTIPASYVNAFSFATSTTVVPFMTFDTNNYRIGIGTSTPGATFSVGGNALISGTLDVGGVFRANSSSLTVNNIPTTAHTFSTWAINTGGASATTSSLVINPSSAAADTNLLGLLVDSNVKFLVDAEGDVFANALTTAGSVTTGSTTNASVLIEGSTYIGDAITDLFSINSGNIVFNNRATSTIPNLTVNAWSVATSSTVTPFFTLDTSNYRVGIGTTSPGATFAIGGAGNLYLTGGLGAGRATTTQGVLETTGAGQIGGSLSVSGIVNLSTGNTYQIAGTDVISGTAIGSGVTGSSLTSVGTLSSLAVSGLSTLSGGILVNNSTSTITNLTNVFSTSTQATSTYLSVSTLASTTDFIVSRGFGIGTSSATTTSGTLITQGLINILGTGSSTFANGINISAGCYSVRGSCLSTVAGSDSQIQYNNGGDMGGAANFVFDDTNTRVGIGTSTPGALFSLASLTSNANASLLLSGINMIYASSSTTTIPTGLVNAWSISTSTSITPFLSINSNSGNVGIGTTSPATLFSVGASGASFGGFYVTSNGQVGIGTTSPVSSRALHVVGPASRFNRIDGNAQLELYRIDATPTSNDAVSLLEFGGPDSIGDNTVYAAIQALSTTVTNTSETGALVFYTTNSGTSAERVRITGAGNVGIGTTSPAAQLTLEGTTAILRLAGTETNARNFEIRSTGDDSGTLRFVDVTGNAVRMVINNAGNVGIGTTNPNARLTTTAAGAHALEVDRTVDDGNFVSWTRSGASKGTVSISGETVSYNAFTGSHYAWTDEQIERGMLVTLMGENRRLNDDLNSEILYGIKKTITANDSKILGIYLSLQEPSGPASSTNPHLVAAVGNMDLWVVDTGSNIEIGDYLISATTTGHAMKEDGSYSPAYIIARAAEPIDWSTVTETVNDNGVERKHQKISVLFESYKLYSDLTANSSLTDPTNAWSVDQQSGKINVNFFGTLNLNGNSILNVSKILSANGNWKIDSDGTLTAVKIVTDEIATKHLAVSESVKIGSSEKRVGITIYDETTGNPYCLKMKNGAVVSEAGVCIANAQSTETQNTNTTESIATSTATSTATTTSSQ